MTQFTDLEKEIEELTKELAKYKVFTETPLAQEYKSKLKDLKNQLPEDPSDGGQLDMFNRDDILWLINRVEQGDYYHAHAEYQIAYLETELNKVKEFTKNEYLKDVESTIDFRGGYAAALIDLKEILK